jgi:hypothetical protein
MGFLGIFSDFPLEIDKKLILTVKAEFEFRSSAF